MANVTQQRFQRVLDDLQELQYNLRDLAEDVQILIDTERRQSEIQKTKQEVRQMHKRLGID